MQNLGVSVIYGAHETALLTSDVLSIIGQSFIYLRDYMIMIRVKRVYDPPSNDDGIRILVDRLWPRGLSKDAAKVDLWLKDIAPSDELRRWFKHDPLKWDEFKSRYFEELKDNKTVNELINLLRDGKTITLLYSAKSPYNNAAALKEYLESRLAADQNRYAKKP